ncbi:branched-chain amino acid ABC transporter permease [Paracraurococcus ruber]|uniref:Branched-chain amino acid ABC transporter permease n=1 Tax=Paracraurococcus ruber TaxID=77675 RepID=A0ABS1CTU1_9PROT|nr:branched-chain amino acid ABC transporter permease [Paracraurococcus ruber]MBK1657695.1 branched-chain amino acid ABC transporter permease [Paracraurococcus ruber]TDG31502.1 branched-chain amino acid ABC transporter permease [Paracraurococcus ruber]
MDPTLSLLLNGIVSGLLLGGLYAAAASGLAVSFGMLDIVNIAHPALMVAAGFAVILLGGALGLDPLLMALLVAPAFALLGMGIYTAYHHFFERRGDEALQGLAFFFGVMFIIEVGLVMAFGPEQRFLDPDWAFTTWRFGEIDVPLRMLIPALVSLAAIGLLWLFLQRTFIGLAIAAVAQDAQALRLMAVDPVRIKRLAFGISVGFAAIAGGALVVVQPIEPSSHHVFIGRVFAVCIMGGMASLSGCVMAALLFGVVENLTASFFGPSWSPAVAFGWLLLVLAVRPQGLFGRAA